jgi:hypothetical protein
MLDELCNLRDEMKQRIISQDCFTKGRTGSAQTGKPGGKHVFLVDDLIGWRRYCVSILLVIYFVIDKTQGLYIRS